jgi:hypothetical protein
MEAGIAGKSGNADGVKASTALDRKKGKHQPHTEVGKDGKRPKANRREGSEEPEGRVHINLSFCDGCGTLASLLRRTTGG